MLGVEGPEQIDEEAISKGPVDLGGTAVTGGYEAKAEAMDRLDVDIDRNIVQMAGVTSDPQTVDKLVTDLEKLDCIKAVNKKPVTVKSENEAEFRLEITSGCS